MCELLAHSEQVKAAAVVLVPWGRVAEPLLVLCSAYSFGLWNHTALVHSAAKSLAFSEHRLCAGHWGTLGGRPTARWAVGARAWRETRTDDCWDVTREPRGGDPERLRGELGGGVP